MRVLLLNGSAHAHGCTYTALTEVAKTIEEAGIDTKILQIGAQPIQECIDCMKCRRSSGCVFSNDVVAQWLEEAQQADGFIVGTPVYYSHPTGAILSALNRMFFSSGDSFAHKPAASIAVARRAGTTASLDVINKYFSISQMPIVSSTYWNMAHGMAPDEVRQDLEGMQTMRNLGRNMAWLLQCIEAGKKAGITSPNAEQEFLTNFIR